jgi:transposase
MSEERFVGIDVSKESLDVAVLPDEGRCRVVNDDAGFAQLAAWLGEPAGALVVMEATGGYQTLVAAALDAAGFAVVVANPRQVRDHARSRGQLAKTDKLDAVMIADFAQRNRPPVRPLPDAQALALKELMARRRQLVDMLTMEKNRLKQATVETAAGIARHIRYLEEDLAGHDHDLRELVVNSPLWREKDDLLRSVPSVGEVVSFTLLAHLPELGEVSNREIAALVGVAPFNCDSGKFQGRRSCWGGRADVRCVLYMAVVSALRWNAPIIAFHHRLIAAGKRPKVAMVACMRKLLVILNTMLKERTAWQATALATA